MHLIPNWPAVSSLSGGTLAISDSAACKLRASWNSVDTGPSKPRCASMTGSRRGECQIDFPQMGYILDPGHGARHKLLALIFAAVYSRHMFLWLTHTQTLAVVVAGCEMAWPTSEGCSRCSSRTTSIWW